MPPRRTISAQLSTRRDGTYTSERQAWSQTLWVAAKNEAAPRRPPAQLVLGRPGLSDRALRPDRTRCLLPYGERGSMITPRCRADAVIDRQTLPVLPIPEHACDLERAANRARVAMRTPGNVTLDRANRPEDTTVNSLNAHRRRVNFSFPSIAPECRCILHCILHIRSTSDLSEMKHPRVESCHSGRRLVPWKPAMIPLFFRMVCSRHPVLKRT